MTDVVSVDLSGVVTNFPEKPNKWDIIPIHTSDRGTFKFCRRKWNWSSPSQRNLVPKLEVSSVYMPFWFGTGIHYALEQYYNPVVKADPEVTWDEWFNLQWRGGLVAAEDIKDRGFADRNPVLFDEARLMYSVEGLREILPEPTLVEDDFMEHYEKGKGMMKYYKEFAEANDNFRVVAVEHDFSVPILNPDGTVMYAVDTRQMPEDWEPDTTTENYYGPLIKFGPANIGAPVHQQYVKQVHARGRMDNVTQDNEYGTYGIIDYKSTGRIDDAYFAHLDLDEQCTTYLWAAEREAQMYDLGYSKVDEIIYRALLKNYPKPPTITSRGLPSINRNEETCTAEQFEQALIKMGMGDYMQSDPKMTAYYEYLLSPLAKERFVVDRIVRRNIHQKNNCGERLYYEARDMLSPELSLYPNPQKDYGCTKCPFRSPCVMKEDGSDYEMVLRDAYRENWDR